MERSRSAELFIGITFGFCGFVFIALALLDALNGAIRASLLHDFWGLSLLAAALMPRVLRNDWQAVWREPGVVPRQASWLLLAGLACLGLWVVW